jgi:formamidopyrimidine-DNA glycosylase
VPELPELQALVEGLATACAGRTIVRVTVWQPAALKTADPPLDALTGRTVTDVWRRGKLIGLATGDLTLVIHLMQGGRLGLAKSSAKRPGRTIAMSLVFEGGDELRLRESATEHRASVHLLDSDGLAAHPPLTRLGPEPVGLSAAMWRERLASRPARLHTALRDGHRVAGIGRAYASDIMWAARLAPFASTTRLSHEECDRLAKAADTVLGQALARARERISTSLPDREDRVTIVHKHFGEPCLRCGRKLERVSFEGYELVYCPDCQNGGRVLADRRLSRLLR